MNANATDLTKEIKLNTLGRLHNVCLRGLQHLIPVFCLLPLRQQYSSVLHR